MRFAHSFGLETYVQLELVNAPETFERFLRSTLYHGLRNGDAVAIGLTYKATEIEEVIDLDARLTAMKVARELREGSIKIGKQFLRNAAILERNKMLDEYTDRVRSGGGAGHHAIAYGLVAAAAKIDLFSADTRLSARPRRWAGIRRGATDSTEADRWPGDHQRYSSQSHRHRPVCRGSGYGRFKGFYTGA